MVDTSNADFSGWATRANLKCSDGRTILPGAFKDQDWTKVPLVWQHGHNDPSLVLGHAYLEDRGNEGVYAWGFFNDSEKGVGAKKMVEHEDVTALSIYANQLIEKNKVVSHGKIRELSLVLAGANPEALIDAVYIRHSDGDEFEDESIESAVIYTGLPLEHSEKEKPVTNPTVEHADGAAPKAKTAGDIFDSLSGEQKELVYFLLGKAKEGKSADVSHADDSKIAGLFQSMDQDQTSVVTYMVNEALAHADVDDDDDEDEDGDDAEGVSHADSGKTVKDILDTFSKEQTDVLNFLLSQALNGNEGVSHADQEKVQAVMHSLNEEQDGVLNFLVAQALEHSATDEDQKDDSAAIADADDKNAAAHADNQEGNNDMTHNAFEGTSTTETESSKTLSHDDLKGVLETADRRKTTFKNELDSYALAHGIEDIGTLFPDAKAVTTTPEWLARRTEWVADIMNGTRHTPFSRIKSLHADLTLDSARAKGYVKGDFKKEEFFKVARRITVPKTIYKKQKLDRDDILDITDFDVVAWLKGEMRLMLEEEVARAILLGDGRAVDDDDKINEENIRPIATDSELYVTYVNVPLALGDSAEEVVDALVMQRRHYRGSGNPTLYTSETFLARLLMVKDTLGRRVYSTLNDLLAVLRVSKIVTCEIMDEPSSDVIGILVNPADYTVGADRGGDVALFDDFDIDYNQQKYLIETRLSGALTKPKSALVLKRVAPDATLVTPAAPAFNSSTHVLTVPTTTGVIYKNKANGATLAGGSTVTLTPGQEYTVQALSSGSGYYVSSTANDEFVYTYEDGLVSNGF